MAVVANQIDQARLAELPKVVLRLSHAVAVGQENLSWMHFYCAFVVRHIVEKSDHGATGFESAYGSVFSNQNGRQVASIAVGQVVRAAVIDRQKQGRVLLRRRALVELMVQ